MAVCEPEEQDLSVSAGAGNGHPNQLRVSDVSFADTALISKAN
jgi:hypothetical protein